MLFSSLAAFALSAFVVRAEAQGTGLNCVTVKSGYLSATTQDGLKAFTTSSNKLIYDGSGKSPIQASYQACLPPNGTLGSGGGGGTYIGRVVVPSTHLCLAVSNPTASQPPYYPGFESCAGGGPNYQPTKSQIWWMEIGHGAEGNNIYWAGIEDSNGGLPQGDCQMFGYKSHDKGVPTTTSSQQVQLACRNSTTPLRLASKAA